MALKYPPVSQKANANRPPAIDIAENRTISGPEGPAKLACPERVPYTLMGSINHIIQINQ